MNITDRDKERYWKKVDRRGPDECWEWLASRDTYGYGHIWLDRALRTASRVAWELEHGSDPGLSHVLHLCDNPGCVNPNHLVLGTHWDNMVQKREHQRGRGAQGEANWSARLTAGKVRCIRELYATGEWTQVELGKMFDTPQTNISAIVRRKAWRHIDG